VGLFSKLFGGIKKSEVCKYFEGLSSYTPVFTTFDGGVYEMELTRAAIHAFANACSKLNPEIHGTSYESLKNVLQFQPNPYMDTAKFLYRIATIVSVQNNAFIVPMLDDGESIVGYFPILPSDAEVMEVDGVAYMRFTFANGDRAAIEYSKVGHITQFQFEDDFFGSDNSPIKHTMQLIHTQNEGIKNAIKNSAVVRFLARIAQKLDPKKVEAERDLFAERNLTNKNQSGLIVHDATFTDLTPIESKPYTANPAERKLIRENVFYYFGVNEKILQNNFTGEEWAAFYSGKIEPFALRLSLVLTNMTFTKRAIAHENRITLTSNRLQHMSDSAKMEFSTSLVDRGIVTINESREVWGLAPVEGGDVRITRREYVEADKMGLRDLELKKELGLEVEKTEGSEDDAASEG